MSWLSAVAGILRVGLKFSAGQVNSVDIKQVNNMDIKHVNSMDIKQVNNMDIEHVNNMDIRTLQWLASCGMGFEKSKGMLRLFCGLVWDLEFCLSATAGLEHCNVCQRWTEFEKVKGF